MLLGLLITNVLYSQQDWRLKIDDEWFINYGSKGLQVGDTMPDIPLGMVMNNYTGKTRFSDFKGKLVILDFWGTNCTTCMQAFPKMEKLQKEFADKIQIFLVNVWETQEQISQRFKLPSMKKFKLPNLPSIVADHSSPSAEEFMKLPPLLYQLFPTRGVPHHVWIDGNSIIRLRGGHLSTYAEKIQDLLAGKDIFVLNNSATVPSLGGNKNMPYYKLLGDMKTTQLSFGSFITSYNNELEINKYQIIDSATHTRITHYINKDLLEIYLSCFKIYPRHFIYGSIPGPWASFVIFPEGRDTLLYSSSDLFINRELTDKEYIKSKYCYEQIVSLELPEEKRRMYMLEDLNRYFGQHLGTTVALERRKIPCYVLVRTSTEDKVSSKVKDQDYSKSKLFEEKGKRLKKYEFYELSSVLDETIRDNPSLQTLMERNKKAEKLFLLFNETGWNEDKKVDMTLPVEALKIMDDLKAALKPYGLDILEKEREIEFMVINKVE